MSLEQAIQENTAAVKALIDTIAKAGVTVNTAVNAVVTTTTTTETPAPEAPKPEKKAAPASKAEPAADVEARLKREAAQNLAAEAAAAAPKISLADLQAEGKKLLDAGKQADLKGVLAKVGGTKLSTLPEEKYAEVLPLLKALTANL